VAKMAQTDLKTGWPEKGLGKPYSLFVFLLITIHHCSPEIKKISNTVR
jgi:hypothetical protein